VLDAAYAEYVRRNDYEAGIELVATSENVVMCPPLPKIYGLAALRLGWMYGRPRGRCGQSGRGPFNVRRTGERRRDCGDCGYRTCERSSPTTRHGAPAHDRNRKLGLDVTPSARISSSSISATKGRTAAEVDKALTGRGVSCARSGPMDCPMRCA